MAIDLAKELDRMRRLIEEIKAAEEEEKKRGKK